MSELRKGLPPGAFYLPCFISAEEEAVIVRHLDSAEWNTELKRRVQHFGYRYDYKARAVTSDAYLGPLPARLGHFGERLAAAGILDSLPDQVIANEYLPGQGISAHVDCVPWFSGGIVSLSLLCRCEMVFRDRRSGRKLAVLLEPRSALAMTGPARYEWTREIPARKGDPVDGMTIARSRRISLTFRRIVQAN